MLSKKLETILSLANILATEVARGRDLGRGHRCGMMGLHTTAVGLTTRLMDTASLHTATAGRTTDTGNITRHTDTVHLLTQHPDGHIKAIGGQTYATEKGKNTAVMALFTKENT
jgi:hypothetical protein